MGKITTDNAIIFVGSIISLIIMLVIFICSIKVNVVFIPDNYKRMVSNLLPQGWGFFTRSPRGKQYMLYEYNTNKVITFKSGSSDNYFGFSKMSRRLNLESERLIDFAKIKNNDEANEGVTIKIKRDSSQFFYIKPSMYKIVESETIPILFVNKNYTSPKRVFFVNFIE